MDDRMDIDTDQPETGPIQQEYKFKSGQSKEGSNDTDLETGPDSRTEKWTRRGGCEFWGVRGPECRRMDPDCDQRARRGHGRGFA